MKHIVFYLGLFVVFVSLTTSPAYAEFFTQCPADTDPQDSDGNGNLWDDNVCLNLAAGDGFATMADGASTYTFGFSDVTDVPVGQIMDTATLGAEFPSPTVRVAEGKRLYLTLSNVGMMMRPDLFDRHTIHWHGFPQAAPIFDGLPEGSIGVNMGYSFTYFYNVLEPGTYMYHCHAEAAEHMQMGMLGNLYVTAKQDNLAPGTPLRDGYIHQAGTKYVYDDGDGTTRYDVDYPLQIASFDPDFHAADLNIQPLPFASMDDKYPMFNGRGYPDTIRTTVILNENGHPSQKLNSLITATRGQRVLLRISSLTTTADYNTVTVLGIPMKVVGDGARILRGPDPDGSGPLVGKNLAYDTSSVTLGGGETIDVVLNTANVVPGTYFMYAANLYNLNNNEEEYGGLMTEIVIAPSPAASAGSAQHFWIPLWHTLKHGPPLLKAIHVKRLKNALRVGRAI